MSRRLQAAVRANVLSEKLPSLPNFLQKLWVILNSQGFEHVICWDESGASFHIVDSHTFCREVLPNFFKHNNLNSFVRQLNLYGFRKVSSVNKNSFAESSDNLHFANQYFIRGQYNQLHKIKRNAVGTKQKSSQPGLKNASVPSKHVSLPEDDLICLLQELQIVRERQTTMKNTITQLTRDNILLWQEMATLRNFHLKQKDNVGKLVQFLMGLGQPHSQKRMPQQQRFAQLEEIDANGGPVRQSYNSNTSPSNSSNCLALQQNPARFSTLDCGILDGIQQELSEPLATHNSMSLDVETALLEGLQLRQRAIEEGGPYLENGILSCEDHILDRQIGMRSEDRVRYYENAAGIQLKRPFQRHVLSPSSPSDRYPKRALYSNQNQELIPASSSSRTFPVRRILNQPADQSEVRNASNLVINSISPPDANEIEGLQYCLEGEQDDRQLLYEDDYANEEDGEYDWHQQLYDNNDEDAELMFMNEELDDQESANPSNEQNLHVKKN